MTELPERVAFFDGQVLRTRDLEDEFDYHAAALQRHATTAHSWGIVRGLDLSVADGSQAVVAAGLAVAPDGRVIELLPPTVVDLKLAGSTVRKQAPWDVWVAYGGRPELLATRRV